MRAGTRKSMTAGFSAAGLVRLLFLALFVLLASRPSALHAQELDEMVALCTSCHGEDGRPIEPDIPIIWGQEYYYLYVPKTRVFRPNPAPPSW